MGAFLDQVQLLWPRHVRKRAFCWTVRLLFILCCVQHTASSAPPPFPGANADYRAWITARLPGNPEGLAIDRRGALYAGLWQTGRIVRLDGEGGYELIATIPSMELARTGITVGMEFGKDGQLYVAFMWNYSTEEETNPFHPACRNSKDVYTGIYQVDVHTGAVRPFLTKGDGWPVRFPDDIAFDSAGNMYVTDLTLSGIWKIAPDGKYSLWSTDPLLQWAPAPYNSFPEGANDLST